ncbi:DUF4411 family protein (plasmid) [Streptomyces sp. CWNU-52B]|uniref:DUF4411 family protein n=1 Tax=unclassified Streptomyces TaxID=2593676 RepID=UPI0039C07F57
MPPLFVIDAHALLALPPLCADATKVHAFFDRFTGEVEAGNLTFPSLVMQDCRKFAEGELLYTWVKAVAAHRKFSRVDNSWQEEVLTVCEELADIDDDCEQTAVLVASMAMMLEDAGRSVSVVTEDKYELPNRMCLYDACGLLEIDTLSAVEFVHALGMEQFL